MKDQNTKPKHLYRTLVSIAVVILLIYISNFDFAFERFDLTEEKRHSLTETTKDILRELEEPLFVKVYLKGEYPAEFKRLEKGVREKLDEMKAYAGSNLEYEFINPSASDDTELTKETYQYLSEEGLKYTSLQMRTNDGITEKILFPGALISYKGKTKPLQLLKSSERVPDLKMINNSLNNLEYEFARIINKIQSTETQSIAFTYGHGEASERESHDAQLALEETYNVSRIKFDGGLNDLSKMFSDTVRYRENLYDMIIISDPDSAFSDQDKFLLDQYLVRGGRVMLFMNPMSVNLDSLRKNQETMGVSRDLNIADMIFDHGIRFENNILIDRNCAPIALTTGQVGNQPKVEFFPWYYKPILVPESNHPIISNIDPVVTEFVSSLTVIEKDYLNETVLLESSGYTKALKQPVRVNAGIVSVDIDFTTNNSPHLPIGVMVEGKFRSAFLDRLPPEFLNNKQITFVEKTSKAGSLLVVADGNLIKNKFSPNGSTRYPIGYDRYAQRKIYGNEDFLLNAVNFMMNDERLINLRSRTITLRPLNQELTEEKRSSIQISNMALPIIAVIFLGIILAFVRGKKFAKK
ncbi:MAG: ABC-2 type transport system permease protein [Patiriisocius sp.]|jgi:ABC-2 type transport system permease protein